jgi:D-xylose 1-dehydrogenase (NADP+, D-xylono-1,5-lactone-forming)
MRLGLMSTANINDALLEATPDEVEIAAVASRDGAKAQAYASEHGIERSHGSYEALLEDDAIDAVYISLPNGMHHEWTMKAIDAGKHVLVEKPYSRRGAEAEEAWDAAARAGLVVMEAFMWRHHPQAVKARELVESGAIGRLREIRTTFSFPLFDRANVRMVAELDGGALMDVGCYCVSGARLLGGEPERVFGEQVTGPTGVDVDFYGVLRFPNDVVGVFDASFTRPWARRGRSCSRRRGGGTGAGVCS